MKTPPAECRRAREALLDSRIDPAGRSVLPPPLEDHFRTCTSCGRYRSGVIAATASRPSGALYTPALRRRTLFAVAEDRDRPSWLAPLLLPTSAAGLATLLVPVWLLARLLQPLLGSEWLSLGASLAFSLSAGLASVGLGAAVLIHRRGALPASSVNGNRIEEASHE